MTHSLTAYLPSGGSFMTRGVKSAQRHEDGALWILWAHPVPESRAHLLRRAGVQFDAINLVGVVTVSCHQVQPE